MDSQRTGPADEPVPIVSEKNGRASGDVLQILPQDIHRMLRRLRNAVEEVIAVTKDAPKFLASAAQLPQPKEDEE